MTIRRGSFGCPVEQQRDLHDGLFLGKDKNQTVPSDGCVVSVEVGGGVDVIGSGLGDGPRRRRIVVRPGRRFTCHQL